MGLQDILKSIWFGRRVELDEGGETALALPEPPATTALERRATTLEDVLVFIANEQEDVSRRLFEGIKHLTLADATPPSIVGRPQWSSWKLDTAIRDGLKRSTWVYACIYRVAKALSSVEWFAEVKVGDNWQRADGHPLSVLIRQPNPFWSRSDFMERLVYSLFLGGESFITKTRFGAVPVELWLHTPDRIGVVPSREDFIARYEYRDGSMKYDIDPADMIQLMFTDPSTPYRGLSPLQVASKTIDTETAAVAWNFHALKNRAVADGAFSFSHELDEEQYRFAKKIVREQHQGQENARAPWVLGSDARWVPMSLSPVDMDFVNGRRMTREEICAVLGVPPVLVGILDAATYSNYETARDVFWIDTVIPLLDMVREGLNRGLAIEFNPRDRIESVRLSYDTSSIDALQKIAAGKVNAAAALFKLGVPLRVLNERFGLGLPDIEGDSIPWVGAVPIIDGKPTPLASATTTPSTPSTPPAALDALTGEAEQRQRDRLADATILVARLSAKLKKARKAPKRDEANEAEIRRLEAELDELVGALEREGGE